VKTPLETSSPPPVVRRLPLAVKLAYTAFVAALVPCYWAFYGPANFLWICDIALLVTVAALWLESRFLASLALVGVLIPCLAWSTDFLSRLTTGAFLTRMTYYMFRPDLIPLYIRAFSLYHGWLAFFLLWIVWRLGYDRRAWLVQTLLTWAVLPVCYFFTDTSRALNGVFGPSGEHPQTWMAPGLWLALVMVLYPLCVYLPAHLVLSRCFRNQTPRGYIW
jgi:hypothetical protein